MSATQEPQIKPGEILVGRDEWGPFPARWDGPWSAPRFRAEVAAQMIDRHQGYTDDPRHPEALAWDGATVVYQVKGDDDQTERYGPDPDGYYAVCPSWEWDAWGE